MKNIEVYWRLLIIDIIKFLWLDVLNYIEYIFEWISY